MKSIAQFAGATEMLYAVALMTTGAQTSDPLPSWNDGASKRAITNFVRQVTTVGSPQFVPVAERIASGARLYAFVHHTDADREWAYDRTSSIGRLDAGLDESKAKGWTVVDMRTDWRTIYPARK